MPPTKPKLFKNTNKGRPNAQRTVQERASQPQASSSTIEIPNQESLTTEIPNQQQYEIELCWCIQQLQKALSFGKLNKKQVQDHTKALNTLMSNTSPIVQKRQVMRLSFGDYREKMAKEEKKISKNVESMKLKPAATNKKTVFLKKSIFSSNGDNHFKFNFNLEENNLSEDSADIINNNELEIPKPVNSENVCFQPSDNSFRFVFNNEN